MVFAHLEDAQARVGQGGGDTVERRQAEAAGSRRQHRPQRPWVRRRRHRHTQKAQEMQRRQRAHTTRHLRSKDKERGARVALADIAATAVGTQVYRVGTSERVGTGASGDGRVPEGACRGTALLMTGTSGGDKNSPSWRETRTERARGLGCGTELVCATSRCGARECTRHRAPRCAARWGVCVGGHLLQKHRCLDSGRVRGRARRVARALVASVGACDTRGVWRTRVPRPCTCAASGPRAYVRRLSLKMML